MDIQSQMSSVCVGSLRKARTGFQRLDLILADQHAEPSLGRGHGFRCESWPIAIALNRVDHGAFAPHLDHHGAGMFVHEQKRMTAVAIAERLNIDRRGHLLFAQATNV